MTKLKVLIVDDSAFMRLLISDLISDDVELEVVGSAVNGLEAKEKVVALQPDVVILDLNMEEYDGLYAVKAIMSERPTPILILSSVGNIDLQPVFKALKNGAVDYINKPSRNKSKMRAISASLVQKIKSTARAKPQKIIEPQSHINAIFTKTQKRSKYEIIAIGASTGGPSAIEQVLKVIPEDFDIPIIICQHMPKAFILPFVHRLNSLTRLNVMAAAKDMQPGLGNVMFCPGHANLVFNETSGVARVDFTDEVFREYNNPSINAMMLSVARIFKDKAVGVILTGMGKDGLEGMRAIYREGGYTITQNEATSIIYGMPKVVVDAGLSKASLDINEIGNYLVNQL
ncbi:MAG: chemotaxis-specific protein-glutamate methyltransferase CheB [Bacteroidota bacterium]